MYGKVRYSNSIVWYGITQGYFQFFQILVFGILDSIIKVGVHETYLWLSELHNTSNTKYVCKTNVSTAIVVERTYLIQHVVHCRFIQQIGQCDDAQQLGLLVHAPDLFVIRCEYLSDNYIFCVSMFYQPRYFSLIKI